MTRLRTGPWIVWYALTVHLVWSIGLWNDVRMRLITPLAMLQIIPPESLALVLMAVSVMAWAALVCPLSPIARLLCLIPQQLLVICAAESALVSVLQGQYGDGVMRPRWFIGTDQAATILLSVFHTMALLDIGGVLRWCLPSRRLPKPQP